jgi:hypothetical protein
MAIANCGVDKVNGIHNASRRSQLKLTDLRECLQILEVIYVPGRAAAGHGNHFVNEEEHIE